MDVPNNYLLTTARLGMRKWEDSDLEVFTAMNRDPRVMEFFPRIWTAEESAAMVAKAGTFLEQNGYGPFAVDELATGEFIGYVGLLRPSWEAWFTPCVEIGWRLRREAWGRGYATEAAAACLACGFGEWGLERIYSFTSVANVRSERVMQKIGMTLAGEFDHPGIESGHPLRRHIVYVVERAR
jgi:RimJ/RimL family protein N-acetyltransferase